MDLLMDSTGGMVTRPVATTVAERLDLDDLVPGG
jgi:hypothetical protein